VNELQVASCELRVVRFRRWVSQHATRNVQLILALLLILAPAAARACPVCFGSSDSLMAKGTDNAMLFMLGIVGFVQLGFVGLFVTFWRRSRALRRRRESFRVLDGGVN
jgi:hypothetical protein